jgi:dTDP-4-dehydrorhamnose reductase
METKSIFENTSIKVSNLPKTYFWLEHTLDEKSSSDFEEKERTTEMILITGAYGQLGQDISHYCEGNGIDHINSGQEDMDITDFKQVENYFARYEPTVVIHCAAYTAVDQAEEDVEKCYQINVNGTENIAKMCKKYNAKLIYISTDYAFDGSKIGPYVEEDSTCPIGVYGKSKELGERLVRSNVTQHFIVRISWVFGQFGNNFVKTMLKLGSTREQLNVVADQIGSPTYTFDLAPLLISFVNSDAYGTYHVTNEGYCSWAEFATAIFQEAGYKTRVNQITSAEYPTKATRPKNSMMSKSKLVSSGFVPLRDWREALHHFIEELKMQGEL